MDRGFHFGLEGCVGLVVLSLRREGTYTVSPSEPRKESPSEPRLPGRSLSRLRSESREPRGARSESRGSSTSRAENEIVSSLENDREKRSPWGNDARIAKMWSGSTALHFACQTTGSAPDFVSLLVSAGAEVNAGDHDGHRPLARMLWAFPARPCHVKILEILLRAGATLDSVRNNDSFDALLQTHGYGSRNEHFVAMSDMVASVRRHGSWKAHCIAPHRRVLRLRSLVARGRAKPARTRHRTSGMPARSRQALEFIVRQGDNGIVWNILSYWRAIG